MPKLSIIVPVYNAEPFLDKCVASLLAQTLSDLEIILVDDGSTDASAQLCDSYAEQHAQIRVIHKENAGVSAARNTGIECAEGDYIGFVDADDWVDPGMFGALAAEAVRTGADLVMCDARTVYSDGHTEPDTISGLPESALLQRADLTPQLLLELAGAVWRCIYRRELSYLRFPVGVKFSEDRIFNLYAMGEAGCISYLKQPFYNRYVNLQSAVHRFHADYFEACKCSARETEKAIRIVWNDDPDLQTAYLGQLISGALMAVCNYYYKTSTLSAAERRSKVKALCGDAVLRDAITRYGADRRNGWILSRNYNLLIFYAKTANWKHGR